MRPYLIVFFACLFCSDLFGQSFYVTDINRKFRKITVENGTITRDVLVNSCSGSPESIAFSRNVMYYIVGNQLFKADMVNDALVNCSLMSSVQPFIALTIDKKGVLYLTASNKLLYSYNTVTNGPLVRLGTMPEQPSGDLIFYKDELYVATTKGIVKVDLQDPSKSAIVIAYTSNILGLAVVSVNSVTNKVYGFDVNANLTLTTVIELDLDNFSAPGQSIGTLPYYVYDGASNVEDGSYVDLTVDEVQTIADCPYTGRGVVKIINYNATEAFRYTLGNETNATGIFNNVSPGSYNVTVRDNVGSKQNPITVPPFALAKPALSVTPTDPTCLNKGIIAVSNGVTADAGNFNILYQGNSYPLNHTFTDLPAGTYRLDIKNKTGCTVDSYELNLVQQTCEIILDSTTVKQDCNDPTKGAVTVYTSPGNDRYRYSLDGGPANETGIFENINVGDHSIRVTSDGGGVKDILINIQDLSANDPTVTVQKQDATCRVTSSVKFDISAINKTGYAVIYRSASYPLTHTFNILDTGTLVFGIIKPGGCLLKTETVYITKRECQTVFFPNAFTPNNDGINDIFRPKEGTVIANLQLQIYNRLGALVYTSTKAGNGWDGQYSGKAAPAGVYYWMAAYINDEGLTTTQNGSLTLIR